MGSVSYFAWLITGARTEGNTNMFSGQEMPGSM